MIEGETPFPPPVPQDAQDVTPLVTPPKDTLRILDIDSPEYGQRVAEGLRALLDSWPPYIDPKTIRKEGRIDSPSSLWVVWAEAEAITLAPEHAEFRKGLLGGEEGEATFRREVETAKKNLHQLIDPPQDVEKTGYFAPFNADPHTCEVSVIDNRGKVTYKVTSKDGGNVGSAPSRELAELASASNMYGRLWIKPEAQRAFLTGLLSGAGTRAELEKRKTIAEGVATFGAIYLSKYAMEPTHSEHFMARSLITELPKNLQSLRTAFQNQTAKLS